jgi:hypothetical protein
MAKGAVRRHPGLFLGLVKPTREMDRSLAEPYTVNRQPRLNQLSALDAVGLEARHGY